MYRFTVEADLVKTSGPFASRADIEEALGAELEGADPGSISPGDSEYDVVSWDVDAAAQPARRPGAGPTVPGATLRATVAAYGALCRAADPTGRVGGQGPTIVPVQADLAAPLARLLASLEKLWGTLDWAALDAASPKDEVVLK